MQDDQGQGYYEDDTALNSICLYCNTGHTICSDSGEWGEWGRSSRTCNSGFNAADFKLEGYKNLGDDTAGNALRLYCSSGGSDPYEADGGEWGEYLDKLSCPADQVICGIKTRVDKYGSWSGLDQTALNGVSLQCCKKPGE